MPAAASVSLRNIQGKDCRASVNADLDGSGILVPVVIPSKTINVEQMGEEVSDDINGDDRQEFQTTTDGFKITMGSFMKNATILKWLLANTANDDSGLQPRIALVTFQFKFGDGTIGAYSAKQVSVGLWKLNVGGRKERIMKDLTFRARYFDAITATSGPT